jgi:hypothetical protein
LRVCDGNLTKIKREENPLAFFLFYTISPTLLINTIAKGKVI